MTSPNGQKPFRLLTYRPILISRVSPAFICELRRQGYDATALTPKNFLRYLIRARSFHLVLFDKKPLALAYGLRLFSRLIASEKVLEQLDLSVVLSHLEKMAECDFLSHQKSKGPCHESVSAPRTNSSSSQDFAELLKESHP